MCFRTKKGINVEFSFTVGTRLPPIVVVSAAKKADRFMIDTQGEGQRKEQQKAPMRRAVLRRQRPRGQGLGFR